MNSELKGRRPERWMALMAKVNNFLSWRFLDVKGSLSEPLMIFSWHFMYVQGGSDGINEYTVRCVPASSNVTDIQYPSWCPRVTYGTFPKLWHHITCLWSEAFTSICFAMYISQRIFKPRVSHYAHDFQSADFRIKRILELHLAIQGPSTIYMQALLLV